MLVCFQCFDNPVDAQQKRLDALQAHLEWVSKNMSRIKVAGPLRQDGDDKYCGSMFIVEGDSEQDALSFLQSDPYFQAGIYQRVEPMEFKGYAGTWVGGENWPAQAE